LLDQRAGDGNYLLGKLFLESDRVSLVPFFNVQDTRILLQPFLGEPERYKEELDSFKF